jgi:hypothetical protein
MQRSFCSKLNANPLRGQGMMATECIDPSHLADGSPNPSAGVSYWTQDCPFKNFGDYLTEWFLENVFDQPKASYETTFLVGSVISDAWIESVRGSITPSSIPALAFWACGLREPVRPRPENLRLCDFFGVRGPLTRSILGLADSEPIGDPGLALRALYVPKTAHETADKTVCVPHILEPKSDTQVLEATGCDVVLSPKVESRLDALQTLIDQIASASLVLAGSLHAAVVACAYRVPFVFYNSGHIDCPFKWVDLAASVGIDARFVQNVAQYREWVGSDRRVPALPPISPLLLCAPFTLRDGCLEKAQAADSGGIT